MAKKKMLTIKGIVGGQEVDIYRYDIKTPTQEATISTTNSSMKEVKKLTEKDYGIKILKIKRRVYYL